MKKILILAGAALISVAAFVYSGMYNIGADAPHYPSTYWLIETLRNRSIAVRAEDIQLPKALFDNKRVRKGAGNYDAMCVGCHLKPGMQDSEIRKGLYPQPPNLSKHAGDPARQFWAIKHGIKMTAMPAWAKGGMDDETIWDMVALLQALPDMNTEAYQRFVASSEGHSHAGADDHGHGEHDDEAAPVRNVPQEESSHPHDQPHEQSTKPQMPPQTEPSDHHHDDTGSKPHDH